MVKVLSSVDGVTLTSSATHYLGHKTEEQLRDLAFRMSARPEWAMFIRRKIGVTTRTKSLWKIVARRVLADLLSERGAIGERERGIAYEYAMSALALRKLGGSKMMQEGKEGDNE